MPGLVEQARIVRDAVVRGAGGLSLGAALDLAAAVEDAARVLRHAQLVAAGAVADAYERPTDLASSGLRGGDAPEDVGPLTFGPASRLVTSADRRDGAAREPLATPEPADTTVTAAGSAAAGDAAGTPDTTTARLEEAGAARAPGRSEEPDGTRAPGRSEEPDGTRAPGRSEEPDGTRAPGRSEEPDGTRAPGRSEEPDGTRAPARSSARPAGRRAGYRSPAEILRVRLRLSGAEARRRVAQARDLLPGSVMVGQTIAPVCPLVGELVGDGAGDVDAVAHILRGLAQARRIVRASTSSASGTVSDGDSEAGDDGDGASGTEAVDGSAQLAAMERVLVDAAREVDADDVRRLTDRCLHLLDQDGPAPSEGELERLQGVFFSGRRDGLHQIRIITDDAGREVLETIFATGTNPRVVTTTCDPDAPLPGNDGACDVAAADGVDAAAADTAGAVPPAAAGPGPGPGTDAATLAGDVSDVASDASAASPVASDAGVASGASSDSSAASDAASDADLAGGAAAEVPVARDGRSLARRRLDALLAACGAALRSAELPATGGLPTQVMVTMSLEELRAGLGSAHLPYTGPVPVRAVRRLACDAGVIPVVLGTSGRVLDVGRANRLFRDSIRRALVARDGGCAFPGCQMPAPWCEAHHVQEWWNDGVSSIDNGVLLCGYHHHLVHDGHWRIEMVAGMPRFRPPWNDPSHPRSAPRRNTYHRPPVPPRRT
ncbi:HNH endonuclease signature motif containing protein [Beutenbergia cavernae]|nr:HNH endonuclease signature motif containing protein [Beutenbergia cavernae]